MLGRSRGDRSVAPTFFVFSFLLGSGAKVLSLRGGFIAEAISRRVEEIASVASLLRNDRHITDYLSTIFFFCAILAHLLGRRGVAVRLNLHAQENADEIAYPEAEGGNAETEARHLEKTRLEGFILRNGDVVVENGDDNHAGGEGED